MGFAFWQCYCTALWWWASAKLCDVEQRALPTFGRAAITLGTGPHSSLLCMPVMGEVCVTAKITFYSNLITSPARAGLRRIVMSASVCVHECLSVCPTGYLRNHTRDLYQIFGACCLCEWLRPPLASLR